MSDETTELERAAAGDQAALESLLSRYRPRLKRMVALRLDRRLQGRIDESDILQETYIEIARRLEEYVAQPRLPFFLWLRHMAGLKLAEWHRHHLGTRMRDAGRDVSLHRGPLPAATSASLAAQLLGQLTSPSEAVVKTEMRMQLEAALNSLPELDREVLALRHFERLSNAECAQVLGIGESGASSRYLRALKKLKDLLADDPGFFDP